MSCVKSVYIYMTYKCTGNIFMRSAVTVYLLGADPLFQFYDSHYSADKIDQRQEIFQMKSYNNDSKTYCVLISELCHKNENS